MKPPKPAKPSPQSPAQVQSAQHQAPPPADPDREPPLFATSDVLGDFSFLWRRQADK